MSFNSVTLECWYEKWFSVWIYVARVWVECEDFTSCHGLAESLASWSDWNWRGEDERRDRKGKKNSKREGGGEFLLTVIYDRFEFHRMRERETWRSRKKYKRRGGTYCIYEGKSRGERFLYCVKKVMSRWKEREFWGRQERTCLWQDLTVRLGMRHAKGGGQRIAVTHWESRIRRRQGNILSSQVWERDRMSLLFKNRQYGLGEWQEKEMDGEITRLRHQRRASLWQRWNKTHFQGTLVHLFFPPCSFL